MVCIGCRDMRRFIFLYCLFLMPWQVSHAATFPPLHEFLESYCYDCHGEDVQKAGLRLDTLGRDLKNHDHAKAWEEVYERVVAGEMPPPKQKRQPDHEERTAFTDTVRATLLAADAERRAANGRVVLRRLNREEYQNTIHDLFGIDIELKSQFPEDASAHGFDNIGEALSLSSVLMERYLEAADTALDDVLVKGPRPETQKWLVPLGPKVFQPYHVRSGIRTLPDGTLVIFHSNAFQPIMLDQFKAPVEGRYRFRISQYAYQSPGKPLTVEWYGGSFAKTSLAAHLIGQYDVLPDEPTVIEFVEKLPAKGSLKPLAYRIGRPKDIQDSTGYEGPGIAVQWVEVEGPLIEQWPPAGYQRMLGNVDLSSGTFADAEKALRNLAPRVFRRPITDADITPYLTLVRTALDAGKPFDVALRRGIKAMLCAPDFLFLREPSGRLDDFALASRLSYFLWSSLPDDELLAVAQSARLHEPQTLHTQVERMLQDPKSQRFTENFTGQWLGLRKIDFTTPDKRLYPEFDDALQNAMVKETRLFFDELLKHDLSVTNFVDSDFTLLNRRLAEHYRIAGVAGHEFRKVSLPPDAHRGGVMSQAAILKITANGTTTSPVIRGNWVLNNILGKPVKPPPPDVPALEPDIRGATTIREQVARHRASEACASCHDKMDPLGLALENYDVMGQWRTAYRVAQIGKGSTGDAERVTGFKQGPPVDSSGVLPNGRAFANVDELKKFLLAHPGQIARCVSEKLLVYATGAGVAFSDKIVLEDVVKQSAAKDYGLRTLIHAVVQSPSFLNK
jgi:hypothetical protein